MSGLRRAFSHPDRTNDPHARARRLVSDRFLEPLRAEDASWLTLHLDGCDSCRRMAAEWLADRDALRSLGARDPEPPRDLGARLAAALDAEEGRGRRRGPARRPAARRQRAGGSRTAAMSMALVAAVAVLALVVLPVMAPFAGSPLTPAVPAATPILVAAAPVAWAHSDPDGRYVVQSAVVDRVCPGGEPEACGTIEAGARSVVTLDLQPTQVILPPTGDRAIAIGQTGVYTFVVPESDERVTPAPPTSSEPPTHALPTPAATEVPASPPADTPAPSDSFPATTAGAASPSIVPSSPVPGSPPASEPLPSVATLPPTPAPVAATALAILEDVVLDGAAPAYSADGQWLAFSARPVDGGRGPDVYVWHVGDERARRVTEDGTSVFSGWLGERILGSSIEVVDQAVEPDRSPAADAGSGPAHDQASGEPSGEPAAGPAGGAQALAAPLPAGPSSAPAENPAAASPGPEATPVPSDDPPGTEPPAESAAPTETLVPTESPASPAPPATAAPSEPGSSPEPTTGGSPSPGSSPAPSASPGPRAVAVSFLLDPASDEVELLPRPGIWRPVVDPSGTTVIYFAGRFDWIEDEQRWIPGSGTLVVAAWADVLDPERPLEPAALPGTLRRAGTVRDWNVRWSAGGDHLAVWLADEGSASLGQLSLFSADEEGRPGEALLDATGALPVFSIDARRLVWATPPGEGGEGSRIGVFAWDGAEPGAVYSAPQPGEGLVVVR
ncbi:MAG: hypothetical protein MUC54_03230 [Chloroflexi bacterium]|nr:hypothetical protein [Chloroflexota bacterium]